MRAKPESLLTVPYVTVTTAEALHVMALALALNVTVQQLEELGEIDEKTRADTGKHLPRY